MNTLNKEDLLFSRKYRWDKKWVRPYESIFSILANKNYSGIWPVRKIAEKIEEFANNKYYEEDKGKNSSKGNFCPKCGEKCEDDAAFCPACGNKF